MKILDRYILRTFLTSTGIWFIVFMALRIVADLFINMNQFAQLNLTFTQTLRTIGLYYGYQSLTYFTELGGVIIVASAAFTLAMMNHTNELTAMLASGVSLFRVIVPVICCSILLSGLIVLDEEMVIPRVADHLVRERDDVEGVRRFQVRTMPDGGGNIWFAVAYDPNGNQGAMIEPVVTVRDANGSSVAFIKGRRATEAHADGQEGWKFTGGMLWRLKSDQAPWQNPPRWDTVYSTVGPEELLAACGGPADGKTPVVDPNVADPAYGMVVRADSFAPAPPQALGKPLGGTLRRPRFIFSDAHGRSLGAFMGASATWRPGPKGGQGCWALENGFLFFPSDLAGDDLVLRRSDQWIQYLSTRDLAKLLQLKNVANVEQVLLTRHTRFTEPINNLVMLLLGLPFILSRERNIKSSATLCLLMVGTFFAFIQICRHLDLPATLSAWLPILLFGPVAAVMLDSVKT